MHPIKTQQQYGRIGCEMTRNYSTGRKWQRTLDCQIGYLFIAQKQIKQSAFNFDLMKMIDSIRAMFKAKEEPAANEDKKVHTKLPNGAIFTGRIINGKLEGQGTLVYENGERYEGEFLNGMKHGKGKYYYIRGELYIGDWCENKKHGRGQYFYENGQRYCGEFKNNMKHGKGVLIEADGSEYKGDFKENRKHGQGQYHDTRANRTFIEQYEDGKLIKKLEKVEQEKMAEEASEFNTKSLAIQSLQVDIPSDSFGYQQQTQAAVPYSMVQKPFVDLSLAVSMKSIRERKGSAQFHSSTFLNSNKKIALWNTEDVGIWLQSLWLSEYVQKFKQEKIDGMALFQLTENDLKDSLGVVLGDRKDLMRELEMMKHIFKKQMMPEYSEVRDIDFNNFLIDDIAHLGDKSRIKHKQESPIDEEGSSSETSSDDEKKESRRTQRVKHERSIEKVVQDYLKKHGIRLNFLIPKDQIKLLEPIGQGGFGQVYLGQWLGQEVAIKRYMKKEGLKNRHIGHFIEQVQLINRLLHPSIVLYMGMCIHDDQYEMVTEFLSNGSLFDYLHKEHQKLSQQRIFYIIKDIALGMTYLHGRRVLHCDLKSSNVLIDENWNVKLCDFGLSRLNSTSKKGQARRVGTPHWMAPEILRGEKYEFESDVYSFGMLVWELLTGEIPYQKCSQAQILGLVGRDDNHQIPLPKTDNQPMIDLFLMCTKRDPKQRPSFAAVVQYLEKHQSKYEQHLVKI